MGEKWREKDVLIRIVDGGSFRFRKPSNGMEARIDGKGVVVSPETLRSDKTLFRSIDAVITDGLPSCRG